MMDNEDWPMFNLADGTPWMASDSRSASREGWDLFEGEHGIIAERIDTPDSDEGHLESDEDAYEIVVAGAQAGSATHVKAIKMMAETVPTEDLRYFRQVIGWPTEVVPFPTA